MSDYSELVESHLTSIRCFEKVKRVEFVFALASGAERRLAAYDVDRMLIHEMREQNITESVEVYDSTSSADDMRWAVEMLVTPAGKVDRLLFDPLVQSVMNRIAVGEQVLLTINPVYGALVLALVAQVSDSN